VNVPALFDVPAARPQHPAKYTDVLLPVMAAMLRGRTRILDPFGGTGGAFALEQWVDGARVDCVELEPEWAAMHPRTTLGNALALPWPDGTFDAICTSPTYGNRMADHHAAKDASKRRTYAHTLGRALHPDNAGAMQWGDAYRAFHVAAWTEARRVLQPGGAFVLNIKDHIRAGQVVRVTDWHIGALEALGFRRLQTIDVPTPSMRYGANADKRVGHESVILFDLPAKEVTP
jgi:tRNA G10  N-methylase Trm11